MKFRAMFDHAWRRAPAAALLAGLCLAPPAAAAPFVWDDNEDGIDDRIETVSLLGYQFAFENGDSLLRKRIDVVRPPVGPLAFSVYVVFDHDPTAADLFTLTVLAMPALQHYRNVPAVRSVATWLQVQQAAALAGVERVEAVPLLYPLDRPGAAAIGVRDPSGRVFPTAADAGAPAGEGIVVAILDTGINDAPDGAYPGHESLVGRFLGGAQFLGGDSTFDTPRTGSVNPVDRGGEATRAHGTHVAGIVLGGGGATGYAPGVAPGARFVDVKTLNDTGMGTSVPEALDWCIHNRSRAWGADPAYHGIDVINLSLGSLDYSDGNDVASRLAKKAVDLGIVVVASAGNDGETAWIPSPASGDQVIAVGAFDDQRSPLDGDDLYPAFNDRGPRASDGDLDAADEQKPDLLAPGVAVLSADGSLSSDGGQYRRLTGSSMSAAYVSGVVAVLRSALPGWTPAQIADLLRATALRRLAGPPSTGGPDPRWRSTIGFGTVDLYAAWLEAQQPARTQVRRLTLIPGATSVTGTIWTQRELGASYLVFERAPDLAGVAGAFAPIDSAAATGDGSLLDDDLQNYGRTWSLPPNELGAAFWYRASYTEGGVRFDTPPLRVVHPAGASAATIEVTIVHNACDEDVDATVHAGSPSGPSFAVPGTSAAVASDWVDGTSVTGNIAWTFRLEVPAGVADGLLPPSAEHPWWIDVHEGGYLNRSGRLQEFELVWHSPGGDVAYAGGPTPQQTFEGGDVRASIPQGILAVEPPAGAGALTFGPNPVAPGGTVEFAMRGRVGGDLRVFDVGGREVGRSTFRAAGDGWRAVWSARDAGGRALPAGLYFARAGSRPAQRLVVVTR